ncbi:hypothetical protein QYM36_011077 [Artemia franciscana]|uniref:Uncharacterized protein n=1 Tax=Artemia franciscana TaxID=6661 RepID=A0AA88HMJ8_ARTSF|nr:hypothetical protein QYM36_011077 [Artemia franciscana]
MRPRRLSRQKSSDRSRKLDQSQRNLQDAKSSSLKFSLTHQKKSALKQDVKLKKPRSQRRKAEQDRKRQHVTTDLDVEEDFVLSDTSSDESLHIGDTEEDGEAFLRPEGIEEGEFVLVKVVGKRITSYFVAKVLVKHEIEDEIEVLFWKRIFPSYKFQEATEKGRVSLEDALMKLPKPITSGGTARQASFLTFGVDFSGFSVL